MKETTAATKRIIEFSQTSSTVRNRTCLHDGLHYGVLRHHEDTIKLFYDDVAKCVPPFTIAAAGSDARNEPRSRLSLQRLTFPSASLLLRISVCDSLSLAFSIVAPHLGNVTLDASKRTKESNRNR